MFEVYCATSPSGKRYVGLTSRGEAFRWAEHRGAARSGSDLPLYKAIRKYGAQAFRRTILERMTTEAGAKRAEQLWIKELGTFAPGGYNLTAGGDGMLGHVHTPEARAKISAAQVGRVHPMLGYQHTPETRARMSAVWTPGKRAAMSARMKPIAQARPPRPCTPETRAKMSLAQKARRAAERKKTP